jgi:NADPH:quinone reductase
MHGSPRSARQRRTSGGTSGELDLEQLAYKRLQILGVTWRTRSIDDYATIIEGVVRDVLPALADRRLTTVIDKTFPLDSAFEARRTASWCRCSAAEPVGSGGP